MPGEPPPSVSEILASRSGEEMALNDRHLNPQMGRILRTLGFDKVWTGGEGAHLIDADGERYLDLFGGYGVFAIGRNHPEAIAAIEQVMAARTGNLPQLGVTLLSGVLAEQLLARAPASVAAMVPANTGTEAVEAAIKIARAATGRGRVLYADHAFHGLTLGSLSINGNAEFREGFGPLLPGCEPVGFGDLDALERELARGDVAAFVVEPVQGKGVNLPAADYLPGAQRLLPRGRRAVRLRRGADRHRAHRALPRARALGPAAGHGLPRQGAVRGARADRRGARLAGGVRAGVRRHGARRPPRVHVRRQRPRGGRRAGHAAGARPRGSRRPRRAHGRAAARADQRRWWSASRSSRRCAAWG